MRHDNQWQNRTTYTTPEHNSGVVQLLEADPEVRATGMAMSDVKEEKKIPSTESPVVARANAILERIRAFDGEPSRPQYQLERPFDGAGISAPGARPSTCRAAFAVPQFEDEREREREPTRNVRLTAIPEASSLRVSLAESSKTRWSTDRPVRGSKLVLAASLFGKVMDGGVRSLPAPSRRVPTRPASASAVTAGCICRERGTPRTAWKSSTSGVQCRPAMTPPAP